MRITVETDTFKGIAEVSNCADIQTILYAFSKALAGGGGLPYIFEVEEEE